MKMTFKNMVFLLAITIFAQGNLFGQWECYFTLDPEEVTLQNGEDCELWENYAPFPDMDMVPIKNIRIAYHVLQDENGENNLNELDGKAFIYRIINNANSKLGNLTEPDPGTSPWITDSRIRFIIDTIYYHQDDEGLWDWSVGGSAIFTLALLSYNKYVVNNGDLNTKQKDSTLHIILGGGNYPNVGGHVTSLGSAKYIAQNGVYKAYIDNPPYGNHWVPAGNLVHEFGHAAGLKHNYMVCSNTAQCDDCPDNDPEGLPCPPYGTSNNYMDIYPSPGGSFSQCQIGKMHYYLAGNHGTIGKTVINNDCTTIGEPFAIETGRNVVWMHNNTMAGNLIIESGATLTVMCTIKIKEGAKIVVELGGRLKVNEGTITSACTGSWQGIEVWGNSQDHQWPDAQGNYAQGYLELNDAVIENAYVAVSLWKPNDYSTTGGIVMADSTVFTNNRTSVHVPEYRNYHPVNEGEMDYRATFTRCIFKIDENYASDQTFYKHVDLSRVKGVKFSACDFSLSADAPNVSAWNMGIGSYSAGFSVNGVCADQYIPCQHYDHSTFTGFNWAINAHNADNSNRTFYVNLTQFNGNAYGIYTSGINNFSVFNSDFYIGYNDPESDPCDSDGKSASGYGIHMTGCNGFAIEENDFYKTSGAPLGNYTGILCKDSRAEHDIIYLNTFNGLSYGNFAEGVNRSDPNYEYSGLEYQCNINTGNNIDFIVTTYNPFIDAQIRTFQGTMSKEAGNTFSADVQLPDGHFKNTGRQVINYFYKNNPPIHYTQHYVVPIYVSGANTCQPNSGGNGSIRDGVLSEGEKQEAEMAFITNLTDFNNVKALFDNLKDGGNTQALKTEVETAWPSDMWALRAELLGKSPHLSKEVLVAAADKTDVLARKHFIRDFVSQSR